MNTMMDITEWSLACGYDPFHRPQGKEKDCY